MREKNGDKIGKLPYPLLRDVISKIRKIRWPSTIIGPEPGEDAGVIDLGNCLLVSHVDPITEAGTGIGRLAVIVSSNDVAVTGARPRWAQVLILLPKGYSKDLLEAIVEEIGETAKELGIDVIGGHTEYTPGILKPIVAVYVLGCACRDCLVPTGNARIGDHVIQIGSAAREGVSILARDFPELILDKGIGRDILEQAIKLGESLSVIDIAVELAEKGLVNAMHDATEGGLLGSIVELALASKKTIEIREREVLIDEPVRIITEALGIDPLRLISSGTLIATTSPERAGLVIEEARKHGFNARIIGSVVGEEPFVRLIRVSGEVIELREPPSDEISRFWV